MVRENTVFLGIMLVEYFDQCPTKEVFRGGFVIRKVTAIVSLYLYIITLLSLFVLFVGCASPSPIHPDPISEEKGLATNDKKGEIKIRNSAEKAIPNEIGQVIEGFFSISYESLAMLEEKDLTFLFDLSNPSAFENANINQATLSYLINYRKMQSNDLSMLQYSCEIEYYSVDKVSKDTLEISLHEHSKVNFRFIQDIDSITSSVEHRFNLIATGNGWKIQNHRKSEDAYNLIQNEYRTRKGEQEFTTDMSKDLLQNITIDLIQQSELKTGERKAAKEQYASNSAQYSALNASWDNEYNRNDAVNYAMKWISPNSVLRNPDWFVYDDLGGNCSNYISQCLLAGGIPMDVYGPMDSQWKWYSDVVNGRQAARGRSPSWTGVNEFYTYCVNNTGFGLVAAVDANFYSGQKGDIILFGTESNWNHAVIVTDIIRDESGIPIDYLINSNTTDRINYPVSAYSYSNIKLIRILGWNNG